MANETPATLTRALEFAGIVGPPPQAGHLQDFFLIYIAFWVWPFLAFAGLGIAAYFTRRFVRAHERGVEHQIELTDLRRRMELFEESLDASQRDVIRLETAQEFTNRLLTERVQSSL